MSARLESGLFFVIPGLFGEFPPSSTLGSRGRKRYLIESLLAKAEIEHCPGAGDDEVLLQLFGGRLSPGADLPSAAISHAADVGCGDNSWWMHADPVFLKPDRDRLLLFDGERLDIRPAEAVRLVASFNEHYRCHGWTLEVGHPHRWYLRLPADPLLRTHPLTEVVGRNIDSFLPRGQAATDWRSVMNEVQMLFHGAEVNQEREARGMPPINSLWFWGCGKVSKKLSCQFSKVYADDAFARGLSLLADVPVDPVPADLNKLLDRPFHGDRLLVNRHLHRQVVDADLAAWLQTVAQLDRDWVDPLYQSLKKGRLSVIRFFPCNGFCYRLERRHLVRFWRRRKALI